RDARRTHEQHNWAKAREMGWSSALAGEAAGGIDGTLYDMPAVVDGLASHDISVPGIARCAAVPLLFRLAGAMPARETRLAHIGTGMEDVAWLFPGDAMYVRGSETVTADVLPDGRYRLHGPVLQSTGDVAATQYLIVARMQEAEPVDIPVLLLV